MTTYALGLQGWSEYIWGKFREIRACSAGLQRSGQFKVGYRYHQAIKG